MTLPLIKKHGFSPVAIVIALLVVGIIALVAVTSLNKPTQIKEKAEVTQPVFRNYVRSMEEVASHIEEDSGTDADSMERYSQRGNGIVKSAEDNLKTLKPLVEKVRFKEAEKYKQDLDSYVSKSGELLQMEKDDLELLNGYIPVVRDYQALTVSLSGTYNYLRSDPARYVKEVQRAVDTEDRLISSLRAINPKGYTQKFHEAFVATLKTEREFLAETEKAVVNRDNNGLATATKKYSEATQENTRNSNRVEDERKQKRKDLIRDLKSLSEDTEREYSDLKTRFKF